MIASIPPRRAVFWYLAGDRIVGAVVSRGEREPVLEACAASYAQPVSGAALASGVLEVAWVLGCERTPHMAALATAFCRMEEGEAPAARRWPWARRDASTSMNAEGEPRQGEKCAVVREAQGLRVWASEVAVAEAAELFRRARLRLLALDCEACALWSLTEALGMQDPEGARQQALSAVCVTPEATTTAEALGADLAVPLGLAVAWFGAGRAL